MRVNVIALVACTSFLIASEANAMQSEHNVERCKAGCQEHQKYRAEDIGNSYHHGMIDDKENTSWKTQIDIAYKECIKRCEQ